MKKFSLLICSVLLVFSACSLEDNVIPTPDDPKSYEGVLTEQKNGDQYAGTHLLTLEGGEVMPARSLSINLSTNGYLNNLVEVSAVLSDDGVLVIEGLKVLEMLAKSDQSGEFIEYRNPELGFIISYYDNWEVTEANSSVSFQSEEGDVVSVSQDLFQYVPNVDEEGNADTPFTSYFSDLEQESVETSTREIGNGSLDAVLIEEDGVLSYYVYRSGLMYEISYDPVPGSENENVFKKMLAEFDFIVIGDEHEFGGESEDDAADVEQGELPEIEDYELSRQFESLPYHFGGMYPSSWYYAGFKGVSDGVVHRYGFSDEVVEDGNELINLYVSYSKGPVTLPNVVELKDRRVFYSADEVLVELGDFLFRFEGSQHYLDLMLNMAASLRLTEGE